VYLVKSHVYEDISEPIVHTRSEASLSGSQKTEEKSKITGKRFHPCDDFWKKSKLQNPNHFVLGLCSVRGELSMIHVTCGPSLPLAGCLARQQSHVRVAWDSHQIFEHSNISTSTTQFTKKRDDNVKPRLTLSTRKL
jgi:hypothetical protein